jgi:hypothetical protein
MLFFIVNIINSRGEIFATSQVQIDVILRKGRSP